MFLASCVKRWRIIDIGFPSSFYTFLSWLTSAFRNQKTSLSLSLSLSLSRSICACHRCAGANANLLCIIPILSSLSSLVASWSHCHYIFILDEISTCSLSLMWFPDLRCNSYILNSSLADVKCLLVFYLIDFTLIRLKTHKVVVC